MLIDNSVMKAFGVKQGWAADRLSFRGSKIIIPATHTRQLSRSKYCSVITQDSDTEYVPVFFLISTLSQLRMKYSFMFSARHDLKQIRQVGRTKNCNRGPQDEIWRSLIVARTVTN